jgi:hypothetical protein
MLEVLSKETRHAFIIAKSDNILTFGEILRITVDVFTKVRRIDSLNISEKKSLTIHLVKKGLDSVGGFESMEAFSSITEDMKKELLSMLSTTLDLFVTHKLQTSCMSTMAISPDDQKYLDDALEFSELFLKNEPSFTPVTKKIFSSIVDIIYPRKTPVKAPIDSVKPLPNETQL